MSRFDWYAASFRGNHRQVTARLDDLGGYLEGRERGRNGFEEALRFRGDAGFHAYVQYGGAVHRDLVHVAFTGPQSPAGATLLREVVPDHRVTRVDVAEDLAGSEVFASLDSLSRGIAQDHRVGRRLIVPDNPAEGRTIYIGARSSPVYGRIYEKGKQVIAGRLHVETPPGMAESLQDLAAWVRCEIEIKPKGEARAALAHAEPEALWGAAKWATALYTALSGEEMPRVRVDNVWQRSKDEQLWEAVVRQYGKFFKRQLADLGDWACVGKQLGMAIAAADARRRARGHGGE